MNLKGKIVYATDGGVGTLKKTKVRVGTILSDEGAGLVNVRTENRSVVSVTIDELVPPTLPILRQRVNDLDLSMTLTWKGSVNHKTASEIGGGDEKLGLRVIRRWLTSSSRRTPSQQPVMSLNFMLDDYELRLVSENGHEHFVAFATTLMAWKQAIDDHSL
jgi:hypothetical protein